MIAAWSERWINSVEFVCGAMAQVHDQTFEVLVAVVSQCVSLVRKSIKLISIEYISPSARMTKRL